MSKNNTECVPKESNRRRVGKADRLLVQLGDAELFHDALNVPYITFNDTECARTFCLDPADTFPDFCRRVYYQNNRDDIGRKDIATVIDRLKSRALYEGEERPVFCRVGELDSLLYVDLGAGRFIKITPHGWAVTSQCPVPFIQPRGFGALPNPSEEHETLFIELGAISSHWLELNGPALEMAYLIGACDPSAPQPVLQYLGGQGSGKTNRARMMKAIIDPTTPATKSLPQNERELFVNCRGAYVSLFDNISRIPDHISDALCRISSGGGSSARKYYTDAEEFHIDILRPVIMTAIDDPITRADLRDRTITIEVQPIAQEERIEERELKESFGRAHPRILGALLDCLVMALRQRDEIGRKQLLRMADWSKFALAAEPATGLPEGTLSDAFKALSEDSNSAAISASPIGNYVADLATRSWQGTMGSLLKLLNGRASKSEQTSPDWPRTPRALSGLIARIEPNLSALGVAIEHRIANTHTKERMVYIRRRS